MRTAEKWDGKKRLLPEFDIDKKPQIKVEKSKLKYAEKLSKEIEEMFHATTQAELMDYDNDARGYFSQWLSGYIVEFGLEVAEIKSRK